MPTPVEIPRDGAAAGRRALAREGLRERVRVQCDLSRRLCARAGAQRERARELCHLNARQNADWRQWHRLHRRITRTAGPWPGQRPHGPAIVRLCMYCARAFAALPLAAAEGEADAAWRAIPGWVRERIAAGQLGVVPSHGICPRCARLHGWAE